MTIFQSRKVYALFALGLLLLFLRQYLAWLKGRASRYTSTHNTSTGVVSEISPAQLDHDQDPPIPPISAEKSISEGPTPKDKVVVMAVTESENADWAEKQLLDWQHVIYHVEEPSAYHRVPKNKGKEAMAYLTFIIEFYEVFPPIVAFVHSHLDGYPRAWHTDTPGYNNVDSLSRLRLDYVRQEGYANLRCNWVPGCPDEVQPFRKEPGKVAETHMEDAWKFFFGNDSEVPITLAAACCSQFAVSREQIRKRNKVEYERYREWLMNTDLDDDTSGRIFEFLWHVIMGREPVHCPELHQCYGDVYG